MSSQIKKGVPKLMTCLDLILFALLPVDSSSLITSYRIGLDFNSFHPNAQTVLFLLLFVKLNLMVSSGVWNRVLYSLCKAAFPVVLSIV